MKFKELHISKGVYYMILATLVFTAMGSFVKIATRDMPTIEVVFFRNFIGTSIILASLIRKPFENKGGKFWLLMLRGFAGTISLYALFYNLGTIGMGKSITYLQTSPIFVALLSLIFLKEKLSRWGWLAIFVGFGGIVVIFNPLANFNLTTDIIGILNGLGAAIAYTAVRGLKDNYDTRTIVLSFMAWGASLPLLSMFAGKIFGLQQYDMFSAFIMPTNIQWLWLICIGLTSLAGQTLMTIAYREEKAGIISTIGYLNIPFALLLGFALGDKSPEILEYLGMILIVCSGILISIRRNI